MQKRYQYYGPRGEIKWTEWFEWGSDLQDPWQLKSYGLRNEFR